MTAVRGLVVADCQIAICNSLGLIPRASGDPIGRGTSGARSIAGIDPGGRGCRNRRFVGFDQNILVDQVGGFSLASDLLHDDTAGVSGAPEDIRTPKSVRQGFGDFHVHYRIAWSSGNRLVGWARLWQRAARSSEPSYRRLNPN